MKKIILLLIITSAVLSQSTDPDEILRKVKAKINTVQDYTAEVEIKIDVNFLKVPETHAKIYFKQPDKVKMESEGFALLPRQGLNFSPASLLKEDYSAIYAKETEVNGNAVHLIKVLPLSDSSNVILSNLYIDKTEYIVRKIETTTKKSGTVTLELEYNEEKAHALPSQLKLSFSVDQMNLPPGMTGEFDTNQETQKAGQMTGTVTVDYKNYVVNQGIDDKFFEEDEKEKQSSQTTD